jgi:4-diphosphocytidyl-2-C-methyl-D-erythritol kinase
MLIHRQGDAVCVRTPAKVNLFLEVLGKRADGYHDLETLMVAVSLYDSLEFRTNPSGDIRLECDEPGLTTGPENLICRAAELLRQRTGHTGGAEIRLWKRIPMAAGLAGGSSDAAAALVGLNRLWELGLSGPELTKLAAELGSDVAFFLSGPAAWCTGRGEMVTPLQLGRTLHLVLVCPNEGLSTAEVYRGVEAPQEPVSGKELLEAARAGDIETLGRRLHNRLQAPAKRQCPAVTGALEALERMQPAGVLMSGSGSTVFALCRSPEEAWQVARGLRPVRQDTDNPRVFVVTSCV